MKRSSKFYAPPVPMNKTGRIIVGLVAARFGIKAQEILSPTRRLDVAWPRQVCMWVSREVTEFTLTRMAGLFGVRDHGTVIWAIKTVRARAEVYPEVKAMLDDLVNQCNRNLKP